VEEPWTILELVERAAETLAAAQPAEPSGAAVPSGTVRANGRVRDVPNERLVRWYVTVGLVDPPLSRRGRVAQYGRRHLLQLVAVKRRQAEGRSLAEIQAELAGATDEALAAVAGVPDTEPGPGARPTAPARFWARRPGQPDPAAADRAGQQDPAALGRAGQPDLAAADLAAADLAAAAGPGPARATRLGSAAAERPEAGRGERADRGAGVSRAGLVHGIRLAPGVTLLLEDADHEPGPDEMAGIVNAAGPLLAELASRHLLADHVEERYDH